MNGGVSYVCTYHVTIMNESRDTRDSDKNKHRNIPKSQLYFVCVCVYTY